MGGRGPTVPELRAALPRTERAVLSLPHRIRYVPAWDHALCRAVVGVFVRAVLGSLRRHARQQGVADARVRPSRTIGFA